MRQFPKPIYSRLLKMPLLGIALLVVAFAIWLYSRDRVLLYLSLILFIGCLCKTAALYRVARKEQYDIITGTCVGIKKKLRRYKTVFLMDSEGVEISVVIDKRLRVQIGQAYNFYFQKREKPLVPTEQISLLYSDGGFLGYEEA